MSMTSIAQVDTSRSTKFNCLDSILGTAQVFLFTPPVEQAWKQCLKNPQARKLPESLAGCHSEHLEAAYIWDKTKHSA